ncbi:MAG TPA: alkylhydroperoxidase domain protein [Chloroflexota bacterium]|nr:alkylhydroperoxidase domain protein [Chloroflexota bacterium]
MTLSSTASDVISQLAGIQPGSALAELRAQRPEATRHAQGSYAALFDPEDVADLSTVDRLATALRVATLHAAPAAGGHYRHRLVSVENGQVVARSVEAPDGAMSPRLRAILRHADLLATAPAQARPADLQALAEVGLSTRAIVTLSQVIAFVSFQVRVLRGLQLIGGQSTAPAGVESERHVAAGQSATHEPPAQIIPPDPSLRRPAAFTVDPLEWSPWLQPIDLADANPKQAAALEGSRGNSPYFRLLARDVDVLTERTATDRGIFYTPGGAPRADRELSAAATSRLNGCIYCASVHARLAAQLAKRPEDIDRLLLKGVAPGTELSLDNRWQGVVDLAVALAPTPPVATTQHIAQLREIGLSDLEILDVAQAGAFFAWANRLMLTLGEPYYARNERCPD